MPSNRKGTETLAQPKIGGCCGLQTSSSEVWVRSQAHDGGDLINQLLVELRGIHDPGVLPDGISGGAVLGVGAQAVVDEIQSCLGVPSLALGEIGVVLLEEPLLGVLLIVKEVEVVLVELLPQGEVEEQHGEQRATKSVDVCLVDHVVRPPQKYFWGLIRGGADLMVEHSSKVLGVTEVNERQTLSICEHDVVRLNVTMGDTLHCVKVEDGIKHQPANILL
jgi:hypothetical protein